MSLRTPLKIVTGSGSARHGVSHWVAQRVTAIILIPLSFWFVLEIAARLNGGYQGMVEWIQVPYVAALLVVFLAALFYHAQLGMQVVIEDYVHQKAVKLTCLVVVHLLTVAQAAIAIVCVLKIALGD